VNPRLTVEKPIINFKEDSKFQSKEWSGVGGKEKGGRTRKKY
jgi:hypothetical protein